ncbi:MAG TPA: M56 family metallopeptidase [Clostridia bacterium]|nr:M56 family metallopeptidase [Clostridia bacterium]HPK15646.1 M56 family metallopeptidase [Clostridia bacterium]
MNELLERLLAMSVQAGLLMAFLLAVRFALGRRVPPRLGYALWLLPAARLLIPFRFASPLSLMNLARRETAPDPAWLLPSAAPSPQAALGALITAAPQASGAPAQGAEGPGLAPGTAPVFDIAAVLFFIWLAGAVAVALYTLFVNLRFAFAVRDQRERMGSAGRLPVYFVPGIPSPCLFGCLRPCVLVNEACLKSERVRSLVLAHELSHFRAGDAWWALLRSACCALHWFNPLVWLAAYCCRADCELACDDRVMRGFTQAERVGYGMALLSIIRAGKGAPSLMNAATAMTLGGREMGERFARIANKPRARAATAVAVLLAAGMFALAACGSAGEGKAAGGSPAATVTPAVTLREAALQTPRPSVARVPLNDEETVARYPGMSEREQLARYAWGQLALRAQEAEYQLDDYTPQQESAARAYVFSRLREAGIAVPEDARLEPYAQSMAGEVLAPGTHVPTELCVYATGIAGAPRADGDDPSAVTEAVIFELAEGALYGADPQQAMPRYLSRAVLASSEPCRWDYYCFDADGDGAQEYYVGFYRYRGNDVLYGDCYRLTQTADAFAVEPIGGEAFRALGVESRAAAQEQRMRRIIAEEGRGGYTVQTLGELIGERDLDCDLVVSELYGMVSYTQSARLRITYRFDAQSGVSAWELTLDWPEGTTLSGSIKAGMRCAYRTLFAAVDLTGDYKEDFIFLLVPVGADAAQGGELHVLSERDGALAEILTLRNDGARGAGFRNADVARCAGLNLLRIEKDPSDQIDFVCLWYNRNGEWEEIK